MGDVAHVENGSIDKKMSHIFRSPMALDSGRLETGVLVRLTAEADALLFDTPVTDALADVADALADLFADGPLATDAAEILAEVREDLDLAPL